jgi:leucyl aminopeptidase
MSPYTINHLERINLVAKTGNLKSKSRFTFGFAPEQPQLGQPGINPGDILLVSDRKQFQIVVSLGQKHQVNVETFRKAGGLAGKWLISNPVNEIDLDANELLAMNIPGNLQAFLEGLHLGAYTFQKYRQHDNIPEKIQVNVHGEGMEPVTQTVNIITTAVLVARELAHEPANIINPLSFAEIASDFAGQYGMRCLVLDEHDLEALKAGAILAVGRGSATPPRLIILEYPGTELHLDKAPVALVGKALTFDSGGYSIKDSSNIQGMKYDKCGGIAVLACLLAAAQLKINIPVVGVIGAAENMISDTAYRPDDIITTLSGKTVEIVSTDAEGRLVLADALTYVQRLYQPQAIIDLATLTGGVVTALGRVRAGIMGNNNTLIQNLRAAGERTMERLWELPLDEEYLQATKGEDADLKNSGGREAHAILGGIFLKQFVEDSTPWAHLDIAGMANSPKDLPYIPKGATGFGVRLLLDFLQSLAK